MTNVLARTLPGRNEFGSEHYAYPGQLRLWVGSTRTVRPIAGETGTTFRGRVDSLIAELDPCGIIEVTVDEDIRAGAVVQATIHITRSPSAVTERPDDQRAASGRPSGSRGGRGGSGSH